MTTPDDRPMTNLQTIRDCIQHLTYSEMMILAEWFANDEVRPDRLHDSDYWAYLLNRFANTAEFPEDEDEDEA